MNYTPIKVGIGTRRRFNSLRALDGLTADGYLNKLMDEIVEKQKGSNEIRPSEQSLS